VCKEKVEAYSLQRGHAELVANVHKALYVVPGDCALYAASKVNMIYRFFIATRAYPG
jgi:hypothetical protein